MGLASRSEGVDCGGVLFGREGVSAVARRHGLDPSQVYAWRRDLRKRLEAEGVVLPLSEPEVVAFVRAVIEPSAVSDPAPTRRLRRRRRTAAAAAFALDHRVDAGVISAVIEALRATR